MKNSSAFYLYGLLVSGDFDYEVSDIDLLAKTASVIDENEFAAIEKMHVVWHGKHGDDNNDRDKAAGNDAEMLRQNLYPEFAPKLKSHTFPKPEWVQRSGKAKESESAIRFINAVKTECGQPNRLNKTLKRKQPDRRLPAR